MTPKERNLKNTHSFFPEFFRLLVSFLFTYPKSAHKSRKLEFSNQFPLVLSIHSAKQPPFNRRFPQKVVTEKPQRSKNRSVEGYAQNQELIINSKNPTKRSCQNTHHSNEQQLPSLKTWKFTSSIQIPQLPDPWKGPQISERIVADLGS